METVYSVECFCRLACSWSVDFVTLRQLEGRFDFSRTCRNMLRGAGEVIDAFGLLVLHAQRSGFSTASWIEVLHFDGGGLLWRPFCSTTEMFLLRDLRRPQLILGNWNHSGRRSCDPFGGSFSCFEVEFYSSVLRFFDCRLKNKCWGGIEEELPVHFWQVRSQSRACCGFVN